VNVITQVDGSVGFIAVVLGAGFGAGCVGELGLVLVPGVAFGMEAGAVDPTAVPVGLAVVDDAEQLLRVATRAKAAAAETMSFVAWCM